MSGVPARAQVNLEKHTAASRWHAITAPGQGLQGVNVPGAQPGKIPAPAQAQDSRWPQSPGRLAGEEGPPLPAWNSWQSPKGRGEGATGCGQKTRETSPGQVTGRARRVYISLFLAQ